MKFWTDDLNFIGFRWKETGKNLTKEGLDNATPCLKLQFIFSSQYVMRYPVYTRKTLLCRWSGC